MSWGTSTTPPCTQWPPEVRHVGHACPFTLGQLAAIQAALAQSRAAGIPRLQAVIADHIRTHHQQETTTDAQA